MLRNIQAGFLITDAEPESDCHLDDNQYQRCGHQGPTPCRTDADELIKDLLDATDSIGQRSKANTDEQASGDSAPGATYSVDPKYRQRVVDSKPTYDLDRQVAKDASYQSDDYCRHSTDETRLRE